MPGRFRADRQLGIADDLRALRVPNGAGGASSQGEARSVQLAPPSLERLTVLSASAA
jgi:hypothetical protein